MFCCFLFYLLSFIFCNWRLQEYFFLSLLGIPTMARSFCLLFFLKFFVFYCILIWLHDQELSLFYALLFGPSWSTWLLYSECFGSVTLRSSSGVCLIRFTTMTRMVFQTLYPMAFLGCPLFYSQTLYSFHGGRIFSFSCLGDI